MVSLHAREVPSSALYLGIGILGAPYVDVNLAPILHSLKFPRANLLFRGSPAVMTIHIKLHLCEPLCLGLLTAPWRHLPPGDRRGLAQVHLLP